MSKPKVMEQGSKVLVCHHCGNETLMDQVAGYTHHTEDEEYAISFCSKWVLFFCPVCSKVTLVQYDWNSEETDPEYGPIVTTENLFPVSSIKTKDVPSSVTDAFEASIKVRNLDPAICVLALRRTLERVCSDQGAKGRRLEVMLKDLAERRILPPILDKMANVLRHLGNGAAHKDDAEFDKEMVSSLIEFTQAIIDYVYVLPRKLRRIQRRFADSSNGCQCQSQEESGVDSE